MKKKYVKARHRFFFWFFRPVARVIARKFHFKAQKHKLKKGEQYLILSNHQSYLEPALMVLTFKRPIYFIASDALYSKKWYSRFLFWCFSPIKKRRGALDINCIRTMRNIAKEGGTVAVFPEGNRQWNDSMFHIDKSVVKLIRMIGLPVAIYNFHGGYGVGPRWAKKRRKGKHVGGIKQIITLDEIAAMSDEQLLQTVRDGLKVIDSDSGELYKGKDRAEYLERQLFICPKCKSVATLASHGNDISCSHCGLTATYGENLKLTSTDTEFPFTKVVDWYRFQQNEVKNAQIPDGVILSDENVAIYDKSQQERILLGQGKMILTSTTLSVGDWQISTDEIAGAAAQDGTKMVLSALGKGLIIIGNERFNAIKYLLYFNRVCKQFVEAGGDKYYGLDMDPSLI